MKQYNGHRSRNAWNVSLWISNDESLYRYAMDCIKEARRVCEDGITSARLASRAAIYFLQTYANSQTPDGAKYNHLSVKLCLQGFIEA